MSGNPLAEWGIRLISVRGDAKLLRVVPAASAVCWAVCSSSAVTLSSCPGPLFRFGTPMLGVRSYAQPAPGDDRLQEVALARFNRMTVQGRQSRDGPKDGSVDVDPPAANCSARQAAARSKGIRTGTSSSTRRVVRMASKTPRPSPGILSLGSAGRLHGKDEESKVP